MNSLRLESVPADCWDWITPDDVMRHALAAFYAARARVKASEGPWFDAVERVGWSSREDFRDALAGFFAQRVNAQAHKLGIRRPPAAVPRDLPLPLLWDDEDLSVNDERALALACDRVQENSHA